MVKRKEENKKLYIVTMYRWGDIESHSYVRGVFSTLPKAIKAGKVERDYRGGKYEYQVAMTSVDGTDVNILNLGLGIDEKQPRVLDFKYDKP